MSESDMFYLLGCFAGLVVGWFGHKLLVIKRNEESDEQEISEKR